MYNYLSIHDNFELQHLPFYPILFWLPGPYFPYHLIINWPQPAWDCLSMPGCFDLHSMLCSLIWSEKLFTLDPFPAVFPSLLSPFDFAHKHRDNSRHNDRKYTSYLRYAVKQKKRYYLEIFPNMGGGLPKSQNFCKFTKYFFVCQIGPKMAPNGQKHVILIIWDHFGPS